MADTSSTSSNDKIKETSSVLNSKVEEVQKQKISLKKVDIAQLLENDDDEYSDVDSNDDTPTADLKENRAFKDSSNLPTNNMESSKEALSNLPIYKKEQPFRVPSAISNQPLRARNKVMSSQ